MTAEAAIPVVATRLENGLGVFLREDHSAPIASFWAWYRVGSRNEFPGKTGISHWVEHMQFKGTPDLAKGQIFREVSSVGGTLNALTSHDWTAYFETVPADRLDLPLRIESDRMVNSLFDKAEVESERTVILSERQGAENDPGYALYEEVVGAAFQAHPYRHLVIGREADLRRMTRDDLYAHYHRFYHPANAFIVAVGDFRADELLERIEGAFGAIPGGQSIPRSIGVTEPQQPGVRRSVLRQAAAAPYLRMAFHTPNAQHPDVVPLLVAEALLSGGQPMGFGGTRSMGRSARLYRALVASGLARSAGSDMGITIDPYLFQIGVMALPGADLKRIETTIDRELARLREEPCPADELARAIRQIEAQFVYSSEGVTSQAYWLGQWEIVDSWEQATTLVDNIRAVSAADVQRVAQAYLVADGRTVGWLEPLATDAGPAESAPATNQGVVAFSSWGHDGPHPRGETSQEGFRRERLGNGITILGQNRSESRSAALRMRIPAGAIHEPAADAGLAHLTAKASMRGSGGVTFEEINTSTDRLGSSLAIDAGRQFIEARIRCLRDDLSTMVDLLAQTVLHPDFPAAQIELVRAEQLGAIAEGNEDTRATADRLLRRGIYPEPNPLGRRVLGTESTVNAIDRGAIVDFHRAVYRPEGAVMAVVGGLGMFELVAEMVARAFRGWQGSAPLPPVTGEPVNTEPVRASEEIAGKSQADVAVGIATIPRGDEHYYTLDVANLILGRLGLMGRLGAEVRDRQGLAYYVFSQIEPRVDGSLWSARAGADPQHIERALRAMEIELDRLRTDLVSDDELRDAKSYLTGVLPLALESHDGVAATLLAIEEFGLGLDYLQRYPEIIAAITREEVRAAAHDYLDTSRLGVGIAQPM